MSNESIIEDIAVARDYMTISVSQINDQIIKDALSLDVRPGLIARNIELTKSSLKLLDLFMKDHTRVLGPAYYRHDGFYKVHDRRQGGGRRRVL